MVHHHPAIKHGAACKYSVLMMQDIVSTLVVAHAQGHTVGYESRQDTQSYGEGLQEMVK